MSLKVGYSYIHKKRHSLLPLTVYTKFYNIYIYIFLTQNYMNLENYENNI